MAITKKVSNPLYVVTNNGVDVEKANNLFDLLLKKTNIDKILPYLEMLLDILFSKIETYPIFIEVKKLYDQLIGHIIELIFKIQQLTSKNKS